MQRGNNTTATVSAVTQAVHVYLYSAVITTAAPANNHSVFIFPSDVHYSTLPGLANAPLSLKSQPVFNMLLQHTTPVRMFVSALQESCKIVIEQGSHGRSCHAPVHM